MHAYIVWQPTPACRPYLPPTTFAQAHRPYLLTYLPTTTFAQARRPYLPPTPGLYLPPTLRLAGLTYLPRPGFTYHPRSGSQALPTYLPRPGFTYHPRPGFTYHPRPGFTYLPRPGFTYHPRSGFTYPPRPGFTYHPRSGSQALPTTHAHPSKPTHWYLLVVVAGSAVYLTSQSGRHCVIAHQAGRLATLWGLPIPAWVFPGVHSCKGLLRPQAARLREPRVGPAGCIASLPRANTMHTLSLILSLKALYHSIPTRGWSILRDRAPPSMSLASQRI
jgi:Cornifin (SPRR) family